MHIVVVIIITTTRFVINTNINTHITQQTFDISYWSLARVLQITLPTLGFIALLCSLTTGMKSSLRKYGTCCLFVSSHPRSGSQIVDFTARWACQMLSKQLSGVPAVPKVSDLYSQAIGLSCFQRFSIACWLLMLQCYVSALC